MKSVGKGILIGFISHLTYFFLFIRPFINEHVKIFNYTLFYIIFYIFAIIISYLMKRRGIGSGLLIVLILPILIFIIIQFLVILAYRTQ